MKTTSGPTQVKHDGYEPGRRGGGWRKLVNRASREIRPQPLRLVQ